MDPTPQTQPEPPADGELSDEQLLQMAAVAVGYSCLANSPLAGFIGSVEAYRPALITYARAAIAADRARHPQAEQMAEALRRLRRWGGLIPSSGPRRPGYSCDVVLDVCDWIDGGMTGPLPPLPGYLAARQGEQR